MLPKQKDIEIPLLKVLVKLGGQGKPKEIYLLVTKKFCLSVHETGYLAAAVTSNEPDCKNVKGTPYLHWTSERIVVPRIIVSPMARDVLFLINYS